MTSETTPTAPECEDGTDEETGVADEGFAEPVEGAPGSNGSAGESMLDALAGWVDPDGALTAFESDDQLGVRALRLTISTGALFGFVVAFGAGVGGLIALAKLGIEAARLEAAVLPVSASLIAGGALLLPVASFLFVAWYDDADLRVPTWQDGHPPLGDVWLLVMLTFGVATMTLSTPAWPYALRATGWISAFAGAYLVLPVWLGWRCLEDESWVLGTLAGLTALLLPIATVAGWAVLIPEEGTTGRATVALTVGLVGLGLPFAFARWSPGPVALSRLAAAGLSRGVELLRLVGHRLRASV